VTAKTNILQNTAILKQIFLQVFAFFALYTNIVRVASAPHPTQAQIFVVQVSHIVNPFSKILKAKFPGYQTQFHICLPSLISHPLQLLHQSRSLLLKIQAL